MKLVDSIEGVKRFMKNMGSASHNQMLSTSHLYSTKQMYNSQDEMISEVAKSE